MSNEEAHENLVRELETLGIDLATREGRDQFRDTIKWAHIQKTRCEKYSSYAVVVFVGLVIAAGWQVMTEGGVAVLRKVLN